MTYGKPGANGAEGKALLVHTGGQFTAEPEHAHSCTPQTELTIDQNVI